MNDLLNQLWAKSNPAHPLWCHSLDACAVSLALRNPLQREAWPGELTALFVGLHDVGKADPFFQHGVLRMGHSIDSEVFGVPFNGEPSNDRRRHEHHSRDSIRSWLEEAGVSFATSRTLSRAIGWHHGRWHVDSPARWWCPESVIPPYQEWRRALLRLLTELLNVGLAAIPEPQDQGVLGMRLSGHIVLCDWIASNTEVYQAPSGSDLVDPTTYFELAKLSAKDSVRKLGLESVGQPIDPTELIPSGYSARPLQQAILDTPPNPGLVIIEAPTGEGKTEAAWMIIEQWRRQGVIEGAYLALPTMATSESLFHRYQKDYLGKHADEHEARLIHGMAWIRDEAEPDRAPSLTDAERADQTVASLFFRPTRKAMLAQHGVGTVDQAMLAAMNAKFAFLRLYGLTNKALVIDEVHAYDAYMSAIIKRLLAWCAVLRIPVILLSATLSARQRAEMLEAYGADGPYPDSVAPYPLITSMQLARSVITAHVDHDPAREIDVELNRHVGMLEDADATARLAENLVASGGTCCVILNTVRQAQAVYRALSGPETEKTLFHARFTFKDREKIANRVIELFGKDRSHRPFRHILIATQVVEQSLDLDFDHMVSQIAPVDLLLQRAGRLHRHLKRSIPPVFHVLLPDAGNLDFGGTGRVYAPKPLLRTLAIFGGVQQLKLPFDLRGLIERCYGDEKWEQDEVIWPEILKADLRWTSDIGELEAVGLRYAFAKPSARSFSPIHGSNEPTGDDNDDGNGWRARTRFGPSERTVALVSAGEARRYAPGELPMKQVKELYERAVKLPCYVPLTKPAVGCEEAIEAEGKLKGLTLIPMPESGIWCCQDTDGRTYEVQYDAQMGLLVGRTG